MTTICVEQCIYYTIEVSDLLAVAVVEAMIENNEHECLICCRTTAIGHAPDCMLVTQSVLNGHKLIPDLKESDKLPPEAVSR